MKVNTTHFEGLLLIEPKFFQDKRGCFFESWREKDNFGLEPTERFVQDNVSISRKNVLRGLHFQKNQGQLVSIVSGRVFDVVVDIRPTSKTYKKYYSITLDAEMPQQIYMPPGFAHGFCVLSDEAILHYKVTQIYDPSQEGGIAWNDPQLKISWPKAEYIISEKDLTFGNL